MEGREAAAEEGGRGRRGGGGGGRREGGEGQHTAVPMKTPAPFLCGYSVNPALFFLQL